jgi:ubiquinone/menaquinone biosynthesis C-methylase UbiE
MTKMSQNNEKKETKLIPDSHFRCMTFCFKIRDFFKPPIEKVKKANIKPGDFVLDYGCGPGSYSIAAAEIVGPAGKVYAADIKSIAIELVKKKALKKGLNNIETIITDCNTGLTDNSIDKIMLFDILHDLENPEAHLKEFYRVLKSNSLLSVDDHHLTEDQIVSRVLEKKLFKLMEKKDGFCTFVKSES